MSIKEKIKSDSKFLVEYLKANSSRYVSKEEICNKYPLIFRQNEQNAHDVCTYIWICKDFVNSNLELFGYLIISNSKGDLKIPTSKELKEAINHEEILALRKLKRVWHKKKACKLIGQTTFFDYVYEVVKDE